jgi:hypothetical protein
MILISKIKKHHINQLREIVDWPKYSDLAGVAQSVERVALIKETTSRSRVRAPPSAIPIFLSSSEDNRGIQGSSSFIFFLLVRLCLMILDVLPLLLVRHLLSKRPGRSPLCALLTLPFCYLIYT